MGHPTGTFPQPNRPKRSRAYGRLGRALRGGGGCGRAGGPVRRGDEKHRGRCVRWALWGQKGANAGWFFLKLDFVPSKLRFLFFFQQLKAFWGCIGPDRQGEWVVWGSFQGYRKVDPPNISAFGLQPLLDRGTGALLGTARTMKRNSVFAMICDMFYLLVRLHHLKTGMTLEMELFHGLANVQVMKPEEK